MTFVPTHTHTRPLPHIISRAQRVTWLKQLKGPFPASFSSFSTRTSACSFITSRNSVRMEKWKVGVSILRRRRHLSPVLGWSREKQQCKSGGEDTLTHVLSLVGNLFTLSQKYFLCFWLHMTFGTLTKPITQLSSQWD